MITMSKKIRLLSLLMRSGEFRRSYDAEQEIRQGHVEADGRIVTNPKHSIKVNSILKVRGRKLEARPLTYILLNKQKGMVCQKSSKERTVFGIINSIDEIDQKTRSSLFCVGRLDKDTRGLLVVTNDGQLEKLLTRGHVMKTYLVEASHPVADEAISALKQGVEIRDDDTGKGFLVKALSIKRLGKHKLEIGIYEGRKRQVRKMLQAVGNEVVSLKRVGIGSLRLEELDFKGKQYIIARRSDICADSFLYGNMIYPIPQQ